MKDVKVLAEIAEMKRIYLAVKNALIQSSPACLVVTSGSPGEGKTTMAAGFAAIAAFQNNKRVLAVDLHWHAPALHNWFGLTPALKGEDVRQEKSLVDLVQSSDIDNLDILTTILPDQDNVESTSDPHGLGLKIINQAREAYDLVIVDTSSIFPINRSMMDPVTISKAADGVVLVVLANVTPRQQVKRAHAYLETAGTNVIGIVVNQWKNPLA
jgi:Mrp family chromosome partitioning ATPase